MVIIVQVKTILYTKDMLKSIYDTALAQQQREEAKDRLANNLGCERESFDLIEEQMRLFFGVTPPR